MTAVSYAFGLYLPWGIGRYDDSRNREKHEQNVLSHKRAATKAYYLCVTLVKVDLYILSVAS